MSLMGLFTGGNGKNKANAANQFMQGGLSDAKNTITSAYDQATGNVGQGFYDARGAINGGTNEVASHLTKGYGDAKTAYGGYFDQGTGAVGTGFQSAIDTNKGAMDGVKSAYQPYSAAGSGAQDLYSAMLGLKGVGAQKAAQGTFSDPYGAAIEDRTMKAWERESNARGIDRSGRHLIGASRAVAEGAYGRQMDYLRMLQEQAARGQSGELQIGQMGLQNAGNIGQLYANQGTTLGNMYGTAAKDTAGFNIAEGTAQANNMKDWGQMTAANYMNEGNRLADLALGKGTSIANLGMAGAKSEADRALAEGQAEQAGFNNIISLGSLIASAATGMPMMKSSPTAMGAASNGSTGAAPSSYGGYPGYPLQF